ncbi:MAG: GNAT family N-acetyltransferase [Thiohalomonadales bacterium]
METKLKLDFNSINIVGERISLSPISLDYIDDIFREFTNEITRYMFPSPPTEISQVISFIELSRQGMRKKHDLVFVIREISTGEFLGVCGMHGKTTPKTPELGIWLKKSAHFQHYGREAIYYLVEWVREKIIFTYLLYPVDRDNIPSRKIAEYLDGKIIHRGIKKSMSGSLLNEVVYKIS